MEILRVHVRLRQLTDRSSSPRTTGSAAEAAYEIWRHINCMPADQSPTCQVVDPLRVPCASIAAIGSGECKAPPDPDTSGMRVRGFFAFAQTGISLASMPEVV